MVGLGDLPGGRLFSQAFGVSEDGSVIVGQGESDFGIEAFIWDTVNGIRALMDVLTDAGINLGDWTLTAAIAVSYDGSIIAGRGTNPDGDRESWIVSLDTDPPSFMGLGDLPGGNFHSLVDDMSSDGSVVVGSSESASGLEAFRWTEDTGMVGLGDLPGGLLNRHARGVSAEGEASGTSTDPARGVPRHRTASQSHGAGSDRRARMVKRTA